MKRKTRRSTGYHMIFSFDVIYFTPMKIWLQKLVPQHLLSRFMGRLGNCQNRMFKNWMITKFIHTYGVNMREALIENTDDYTCFNSFFTRHLKPGVRNFNKPSNSIISPADGVISEFGSMDGDHLLQAKGSTYSLQALLASRPVADLFSDGHFMTIYLAPKDYHRVHMPLSGKLIKMTYVPGSLFSVNDAAVVGIPGLFAKNERVICLFETEVGLMAVILVGAMIVGSIHTTWHGCVTPSRAYHLTEWDYEPQQLRYNRGDEIGFFQMGSTAIVLFQKDIIGFEQSMKVGSDIRLGDAIATLSY